MATSLEASGDMGVKRAFVQRWYSMLSLRVGQHTGTSHFLECGLMGSSSSSVHDDVEEQDDMDDDEEDSHRE